jgi:dienelactone hydrolase
MEMGLTPDGWLDRMVDDAPLKMIFGGSTQRDWSKWRNSWREKLTEILGPYPEPVPLEVVVSERVELDTHFREKVLLKADNYGAIPAYIMIPKEVEEGDRRPGILCAHGHDAHNLGKAAVSGVDDERVRDEIRLMNYDYARQLVERGYVTIVPDWRAFGERFDRTSVARDPCNVIQNSVSWLGYNLLTLDIHDARLVLDYLQGRPEVDDDRLGMVGLSYGGRVTTFTAALDDRIVVAVVSGALNCFVERIKSRGSCGSQVVPGLLRYGDIPEILGLIAPRPLLIERGIDDGLLPADYFEEGYSRLRKIYEAAGAGDRLSRDDFQGGHRFNGVKALPWLDSWLTA